MASKKAYVMIILAVILWSSTFTFIQIGLKEVTPIYIGALRFVIASMLLIVYVLIKFKIEEIKNFTKIILYIDCTWEFLASRFQI